MSEAISLEFIGFRIDSVQNDMRDIRRTVINLTERFNAFEVRLGGIESRIGGVEGRIGALELRFDEFMQRQSRMEEQMARQVLLLSHIAAKLGVEG